MDKINISFIIYGGLSYGGAHKQSINLAKILDKTKFNVRYFWCKHNKDLYSDFIFPKLNLLYLDDLRQNGVEVVEFIVGYRDISHPFHSWYKTNFFEVFNQYDTDIVFSSRSGRPEFPFVYINKPIIEWNIFGSVDTSENIIYSVSVSDWVHRVYTSSGGDCNKSSICYAGIDDVVIPKKNLRSKLNISKDSIVVGFHQRVDDKIFSKHAIEAWKKIKKSTNKKVVFIILGGSSKYIELSKSLDLEVIFLPQSFDFSYVSYFLNTLDIFSHSAGLGETAGLAIQEAMMHGVPVVSKTGINNGHLGVISNTIKVAKNEEEYFKILKQLIDDEKFRKNTSEKVLARARKKFSISAMQNYFEALFINKFSEFCIHSKDYKIKSLESGSKVGLRSRLYRVLWRYNAIFVIYGFLKKIKNKIVNLFSIFKKIKIWYEK